jgi:xylulokinase
MECGDASGTGFLDIRRRRWSQAVLRAIDPDRDLKACLPDLIAPGDPAGRATEEAAGEFGLPEGIPVSAGGGDNMMGAIGTGTNTPGSLTVSLGTSGTLYGYSDKPVIDPKGRVAAFCSSTGGWLPLVCTMNCTVATELVRGILGADLKKLEKLAARARPGCDGVVTLPFFNGERTPSLPNGRGCVMGLNPANFTRENLLRSSMESGVFGLKAGLDVFAQLGFSPGHIALIGGGSKSPLWRQITADIFDLPVVCPAEEEAAAFGACLQALWMLEGGRNLDEILEKHVSLDRRKSHRPDPKSVKAYRAAYERYKKYVEAVSPMFS